MQSKTGNWIICDRKQLFLCFQLIKKAIAASDLTDGVAMAGQCESSVFV